MIVNNVMGSANEAWWSRYYFFDSSLCLKVLYPFVCKEQLSYSPAPQISVGAWCFDHVGGLAVEF